MAEPIDLPFGLWTLWWTEGCMRSIVFATWRQCAFMGGHIGATWRILLNRPTAAAMRPYVKLLWPLVILLFLATTIYVLINGLVSA